MARKKPIKDLLDPADKRALEKLYLAYRVASDQLRRCPEVMQAITDGFAHVASGRVDAGTLLRYILNRRKDADWPKLGAKAQRFSTSLLDLLAPKLVDVLKGIYVAIDIPLDEYLFRRKLVVEIEKRFAAESGSSESGDVLVAVMMTYRKRGFWPTIREATPEKLRPFGDIDEVAVKYAKRA
jgi:hypothetical protein